MKYVVLAASVVTQVCLGGLYAWSSFVPALQRSHNLSTAQTQLIFGILIAVFTLVMVFAGRLLERRDARLVASVGGLLFGAGYVIASFSNGSFAVLLLGISVVAGAGTGFGYVCPLTTCIKWFPSHKGLVTGIAVAGFGGGAILLSTLAEVFLGGGTEVLMIFRWIGIVYGATIMVGALAFKSPVSRQLNPTRSAPVLASLMHDRFFWALVVGMFSGTFAGLLVIGNLKPLALSGGLPPVVAATAISTFALGNVVGRMAWGWIADRIRFYVVSYALGILAIVLCGLVPTSTLAAGLVTVSALVGFGFGACFVIYATQVASRYGPDRVGNVYPVVFLSYGLAGISGPSAGGWLYDVTASYVPAIITSVAVVLIGLSASGWLLRSAKSSWTLDSRQSF